jgi:hypothetical protein
VDSRPQPAGFGNCGKCPYRSQGTAQICFDCASSSFEKLAKDRCELCELALQSDGSCGNPLCNWDEDGRFFRWVWAISMWWLPLAGLAVSLAIGVVAISQPEIETGQNLSLVIAMDDDVEAKRQLLLRSVADAIDANTELLAGKLVLATRATTLIGLAFALLGIAQLAPVAYDLVTRMST